jgi:sugar lactone lactonase YvrE
MAASVAIGQPGLEDTFNCANNDPPGGNTGPNPRATPTAMNMCEPSGIAFDAKGNLWIADGFRVLEYLPPFKTGMGASLEIGQPASSPFGDNPPCATSASCIHPVSIAFDSSGNLWAVDIVANRILRFAPPFSMGMSASLVLGQPNFTSDTLHPPAANSVFMTGPAAGFYGAVSFDSAGNLLVADGGNSRVLAFAPPFSSNMNASIVIGQPDFKTTMSDPNSHTPDCASPTDATKLCYAQGVLAF